MRADRRPAADPVVLVSGRMARKAAARDGPTPEALAAPVGLVPVSGMLRSEAVPAERADPAAPERAILERAGGRAWALAAATWK